MTREEYNLWFSSRGLMGLSWILGWDKNVVRKLLRKRRRGFLSLWATSALVFFMCFFTPSVQAGNLGDISSDIMTDNMTPSTPLGRVFNAVNSLMGPEQDDAHEELNDEENATMETLAVETPAMGIVTLGSRLASLRAGAASLFAFNIDREKDRGPILLASQNSSTASDAAARSDNSNAFSRLGFFLNGIGAFGDRGSTLNPSAFEGESGFDFETSGVLTGLDYRFTDEFILGTAFGYATTDADLDDDGGDIDADGYNVSVYGTYYVHQFYIDAIAGFGGNDYDATRNIRVSGLNSLTGSGPKALDGVAKADIDGWHYSFSVGAGYDFTSGGFNIGPYARLNYFRMRIDNYREEVQNLSGNSDVEGVGLKIEDQDIVSLATVVGGQVSYSLSTALGVFVPHVSFEWEHEYDNDSREVIAEYVHDDGNNRFTIKTDSPDRNFFNLGVGLSAVFPRGITAFVYYDTPIGLEDVTSHNFTGGLRFEF